MKNQPTHTASWSYAEIWNKFPPPARPSKEELIYFEQEIKAKKRNGEDLKLLILGTTIEYLSLAKKLGITPVVADFSKSNYETLTEYADEVFSDKEFLEIDWLKINDKNKYDVILGHRPINVIGHEALDIFFERIYSALKPGGTFYCKGNIKFANDQNKLQALVEKWAFNEQRELPLFSYLEVELYFLHADKFGYIEYPKAQKTIEDLFAESKISKDDYDLAKLLVSLSDDARFRGLITEEEIKSAMQKAGFKNVVWLTLDKDICQNMPIIKMIK